ncbi:DUF7284 family protein [Halosimplex salinum]|uniref:DUF7284 family protein n=1 Tax=Halosimplex salinum TaxID=1710538 RepID=UPI0013DDA5B2|nr:hypothetical protein [Halosimplex salinum]
MDVRASSTVLDTVVFVLLVGVAVGILAGVDVRETAGGDRVAEETADVLATSTTELTYTRTAQVQSASVLGGEETETVSVARTARGTHAQLLAAAAVSTPSLAAESLVGTGETLRTAVRPATRRILPTRTANVQVGVAWYPYPNATLHSSFTVGDSPPRDADVSVTTARVASGLPNVSAEARRAVQAGGYDGVATVLARAVVDGLFPPAETRSALYSEGPDRALTAHRYRTASELLGSDADEALGPRSVAAANRRLADALADRLRADLRHRYDSPDDAARAVRAHQVRLVVRTWEP